MEPFKLTLADNTVVSGLKCSPLRATGAAQPKYCPLVVGLHGGSYASSYFDATPTYSALATSTALSVPFVAIDRPGYGLTPPAVGTNGDIFAEAWGKHMHVSILPTIWAEFGKPNGCTCLVLLCHSLGVNGAIVAAALNATSASYPLGGLICSGLGIHTVDPLAEHPASPPEFLRIPIAKKDTELLRPGTAAEEVLAQSERLDQPVPFAELDSLGKWLDVWQAKWSAHVTAPVMFALAGRDNYWQPTEAHLKDLVAAFPKSSRVDTSIIASAPHNLEISYWSQGWYARSFGFALECAAAMGNVGKK